MMEILIRAEWKDDSNTEIQAVMFRSVMEEGKPVMKSIGGLVLPLKEYVRFRDALIRGASTEEATEKMRVRTDERI